MKAIQYHRSVARFLASRYLGGRLEWVCTSPLGTTRLVELPPPDLAGPEWVRVRPLLSGICGSDLATITARGSTYFSGFTSCPFVFGHEVVGQVVEVGASVRRVKVGDRVVLEPPLHCRVRGIDDLCGECRNGYPAQCSNITRGTISAGLQTGFCRDTGGGWSESFVAHELQLHPVPVELDDDVAVLVEPLSCCLQAARKEELAPGQEVLVVGCGTIGILTIAAIKQLQPEAQVLAIAKYEHQKEWALRLGADRVAGMAGHLFEEIASVYGADVFHPELSKPILSRGASICFDCVGSSSSIDDSLRFVSSRGTVILVGMPGVPRGVDWTSIWYRELHVQGSYTSTPDVFREAVLLAQERAGNLKGIVGARFPLRDFSKAIRCALHSGEQGVLKTVLYP